MEQLIDWNFVLGYDPVKLEEYKRKFPKRSYGELRVKMFLEKNRIEFLEEVKAELINHQTGERKNIRMDFVIPKLNTIIEYNGRQHYEPVEDFGGIKSFERQQERDLWLRNACITKGYTLIEIPYYEHVETQLESIIELYNA